MLHSIKTRIAFSASIVGLFSNALLASAATAMVVGPLSPTSAILNQDIVLSAVVWSDATVSTCDLYVDGKKAKAMGLKDTVATVSYKFTANQSYKVFARCVDSGGLSKDSAQTAIIAKPGTTDAKPGDRVKSSCPSEVEVNHPCTTVYYYGNDGRRHAFPNEVVYKQWFKDFSGLVILSSDAMAAIPMGKMVTHKPGAILVKFTTNTVYAVSNSGVLRPIATEDIAKSIFGADWSTKVMDVNDAFYSQYRFGRIIDSTRDFDLGALVKAKFNVDDVL